MIHKRPGDTSTATADDDFIGRWSSRKLESQQEITAPDIKLPESISAEADYPTDEDMPPIESLSERSDYSPFLSPRVSEHLRQLALRKLFRVPAFNLRDGLDDYDDDFTAFVALGDIVTADLRHRLEVEARKRAAAMVGDDELNTASEEESGAHLNSPHAEAIAVDEPKESGQETEGTQAPLRSLAADETKEA